METVYKLVKRVDDKLVSIRATGKAEVEYKIGEWSQAPEWLRKEGYDLCIFTDKAIAQDVQQKWEKDNVLFECEADGIHQAYNPYLSIAYLSDGKMEDWDCGTWPSLARLMAEKIRLIREIS